MGLSGTVSVINGDFSRKSLIFPTPIHLELGIGAWGQKNYNDGATEPRQMFDDMFSPVDTIHERDKRTDGRTDRHRPTAKTALTHSVAR